MFDQLFEYRLRLLTQLEQQPAEVAALLAALPESAWYQPRSLTGRSLHQLAAHVRDLETLAFLPRLRRIMTEDRPILEAFASHDWSSSGYRPDEPMTSILANWSQARAEVLDLLPTVSQAAWSRTSFHSPSGPRTLQWWAERTLKHVREHLLDPLLAGQS